MAAKLLIFSRLCKNFADFFIYFTSTYPLLSIYLASTYPLLSIYLASTYPPP